MLESLATHTRPRRRRGPASRSPACWPRRHDHDAARRQLDQVSLASVRDHHVVYGLGAAYAQLGDIRPSAIHWLRIAADTGFPCVLWFERDPWLEPLRRHPAYAELLAYVRTRRDASLSAGRR